MPRKVLITGATSGIGEAIASHYSSQNYEVLSVSRTSTSLTYDLSDQTELAEFLQLINKGDIGPLDVLVNNAGVLIINEEPIHANGLFNLLLYTPYMLMMRLASSLRQRGGHIINIASVAGIEADQDLPLYSAFKAGLISLTKSFSYKLAPYVRVNCISPGFFDTNLVPGMTPNEMFDNLPVPREGQPWEIKTVIQMLDTTPYMTGANIVVDGGLTR